jgi:hypothetical protein
MADQVKYPGRLIAVDGSRGKDVNAAAGAIAAALTRGGVACAVSRWDASGLFTELTAARRGDRHLSIRTLSLIYAADLAFRLRWEVRPVLESGGVVIAAPYVETVVAFGASSGLDEDWLRQLLRFAPRADLRGLALERKIDRPWKQRTDRGYAEYCATMLAASSPKGLSKKHRRAMVAALDRTRGRKIFDLTDKGVAGLARACRAVAETRRRAPTDSLEGGSRRSASRPRTGRR